MDLYILRHGKAEELSQKVKSDSKRKLTEAGRTEMELIARSIRLMGIKFTLVASSPLIRARQTAGIVAKAARGAKCPVEMWAELKPESDPHDTINRISDLGIESCVLAVGHEPHLSDLIGALISDGSGHVDITLKKGGLAHLSVYRHRSELSGTLRSIMTPKQLRKMSR